MATKKVGPALRSAPTAGAGVVRKSKRKPFSLSQPPVSPGMTDQESRYHEQQHHHLPAPQSTKVRQAHARNHVRAEEPGVGGGGQPVKARLDGAGEGD